MARRFFFRTNNGQGSTILPVADGSFFTEDLTIGKTDAEVYLEFYSDANATTPVTPTGGEITISARPMENNYLLAGSNATIQAVDVKTPDSTYTPPVIDGLSTKARITFSGITGASYCKAILFKHGG